MPIKTQIRFECDSCGAVEDVWAPVGQALPDSTPEGWQARPLDPGQPLRVYCADAGCQQGYTDAAEEARQARLARREEARATQAERRAASAAARRARKPQPLREDPES